MPVIALTNAELFVDSHDFTGDSNEVRLQAEADQKDKTNMRSGGWREYAMTTKTSTLTAAGMAQWGTDTSDEWQWANFGATGKVVTIGAQETEGQPAYMLQSMPVSYQVGGSHGELAPFSLNGVCSDGVGVVRGVLMKAMGTVSATGALGTAVQLGAVSASQYVYSTLHLFGTAGTTITVVLESDDASGFPSATTRVTHGPYTTVGGRWGTRVAGSITDTWWRYRVTAITGTWTIAAAAGIQ